MSEKSVNKRIRKILEQDLAEAVADVLRAEARDQSSEILQKVAERRAQTLGRFEASVRSGPLPSRDLPAPPKWGDG